MPLGLDWDTFVDEWCLGTPPTIDPTAVDLAFEAIQRLWPEVIDATRSSGQRGLLTVVPLINLGHVLALCEHITGFSSVFKRVKAGERSALSELKFAARLVARSVSVSLEPTLLGKVPDTLISFEGQQIFAEVVSPDRAKAFVSAQEELHKLATLLSERNPGRRIEVLLKSDLTLEHTKGLLECVSKLQPSEDLVTLPEIAVISVFDSVGAPAVGPTIPSTSLGPILATAVTRTETQLTTAAIVRLPVSDQRARRVLYGESHHLSPKCTNILVINMNGIIGGVKQWQPLVIRSLQPNQNRRFGAVVLFSEGLMIQPVSSVETWQVVRNPYAYNPVPEVLLNHIQSPNTISAAMRRPNGS